MTQVETTEFDSFLEDEDITDDKWESCEEASEKKQREQACCYGIILWYIVLTVLTVIVLILSIVANNGESQGRKKRELLDQMHVSLGDRFSAPNVSIDTVSFMQSVQRVDLYADNKLNLYMGCVETVSECVLDHTEVTVTPSSVSCDTPMRSLTIAGFINLDIYCSIDNTAGETNPIVASLNIFGGQIKCVCSLMALNNPTGGAVCKLHVRRCPNTI